MTICCGFVIMEIVSETMMMSIIMPAAQCDLNLSASDKGILSASAILGKRFKLFQGNDLHEIYFFECIILIQAYTKKKHFCNQLFIFVFFGVIGCRLLVLGHSFLF